MTVLINIPTWFLYFVISYWVISFLNTVLTIYKRYLENRIKSKNNDNN